MNSGIPSATAPNLPLAFPHKAGFSSHARSDRSLAHSLSLSLNQAGSALFAATASFPAAQQALSQRSTQRVRQGAARDRMFESQAAPLGTIQIGTRLGLVVNESDGAVRVRITRTDDTSGTATADYVTVNGTARAGADYRATSGTVTFAPGETVKIVPIPIFDNSLGEADENFSFSISGVTGATLSVPRTANIRIIDNDSPVNDLSVNLPDFADVASLSLNGSAAQSNSELHLTPDQAIQRGSVFARQGMAITHETSFQTRFQFRLTGQQGTTGAQGFTFMLQNAVAGTNALGWGGASLGYGNIGNSLAIEFDTTRNAWDTNNNHVSVLQNGNVKTPIATTPTSLHLNSGEILTAWVEYDGDTNGLRVFLSTTTTKPTSPVLSTTVDLEQIVGSTAFVGFSAATASTFNRHGLLNWQLSSRTGAPQVGFGQRLFVVKEEEGSATVVLKRSGSASSSLEVNLATSSGSATANSDYTPVSTRITFAPGELSKTVTVPIANDSEVERNEFIRLQLSNPAGGTISLAEAVLRIQDNDAGNFATDTVVSGLTLPTAFDWTPDGQMLVAQKNGIVRVFRNGQLQPTPFIDLSAEVNNVNDRGLLGIAVHPDFAHHPYVYLLYTYDPPQVWQNTGLAGPDGAGNRPSRLVRVRLTVDEQGNTIADPHSDPIVLLGRNSTWEYTSRPDVNSTFDFTVPPSGIVNGNTLTAPPELIDGNGNIRDYLATDSQTHSIGTVRFGTDGSLFVSNGDGTSFGRADRRTLRVQDLDNLSGKILRIDPMTGEGLPSNPFFSGDPNRNRSKVYSYGFRNPFRFAIDPATNEPVVGDVGWASWEEINTGRGRNFGWPFYEGGSEGNVKTPAYSEMPEAEQFYASASVQAPIYAIPHSELGAALIAGDFYTGDRYPDIYRGNLFFSNIRTDQVYVLFQDEVGYSAKVFATQANFVTQIKLGQDSNLYFNDLAAGRISRWRPV